jgi:hypothetical protein
LCSSFPQQQYLKFVQNDQQHNLSPILYHHPNLQTDCIIFSVSTTMPPTKRLPEKSARCQTRRRRRRRKTTPCLPTRVTVAKSFHRQQLRKAMLTGPVSSAHKDHKEQSFERRSLPWLLAAAWTTPLAVVVVVSFWMAEPACNDDAAAALVDVVVGGGGDQMRAEVPPLLAPLATALQLLGVVVDVVLACNRAAAECAMEEAIEVAHEQTPRFVDKHARARAHPAVERTTQLIFTLSSARRKETQLYHQGKKKVEKNKGISERFLVSFILLVIFFPCSCGILVQFYTTLELICPQIFQAYRERERERIRGALR